jgi:hypothetical protein
MYSSYKTVLKETMQALVCVQARVLARIVAVLRLDMHRPPSVG